MRSTLLTIVFLCVLTLTGAAQQPSSPRFEVASVKVNNSGETDSFGTLPASGRIALTNETLRNIIIFAFGINRQVARFTLIGGSERIMTSRFDINAKPPDDAPAGEWPVMLRTLLSERFQLQTHTEKRDIPVYALRVATAGRLGRNLRASTHDCDAFVTAVRGGAIVAEPSDANGQSWCRANPFASDGIALHQAGPVSRLIRDIQGFADRPIVDMTGLTGTFEWEVKFVSRPGTSDTVPNMFTAFREELGLKLEAEMAPNEVLVVDRVEMPTPN